MKRRLIIVTCLATWAIRLQSQDLPGLSYGLLFDSKLEMQAFQACEDDNRDPLVYLLAHDPQFDSTEYDRLKNQLTSYANELQTARSRFKTESRFLRYLFYKVHRTFLKQYSLSEPFNGLFNRGSYNCVSGTALYAFFLDQLGYAVRICETRYHIFLLTYPSDSSSVLFEATDPLDGFVENQALIEQRIALYLSGDKEERNEQTALPSPGEAPLFHDVSLKELAGLHYYNLAVDLINKQNYYDAFRALKKASFLYPDSERIRDFLKITSALYEGRLSRAFVK